jgi:hypothetical protein
MRRSSTKNFIYMSVIPAFAGMTDISLAYCQKKVPQFFRKKTTTIWGIHFLLLLLTVTDSGYQFLREVLKNEAKKRKVTLGDL